MKGKYRALVSFVGKINMRKGEEKELDYMIAIPLVNAGYLKVIVPPKQAAAAKEVAKKKTTTKKKSTKKKSTKKKAETAEKSTP